MQNLLGGFLSYLHDDEDDQGDEDVDLRVLPGLRVSDVVELLSDALFGPRPVVQQCHQSLLLGQLKATGSDIININTNGPVEAFLFIFL